MKVLFVDDEDDIRELIEFAIVTEDDIEPSFAGSGLEAISMIETQPFDIILLDVMMPPPDGLEVLRVARANANVNGAKIVMCTAQTSLEAEKEFREAGADCILHKPFKPLKLAGFLRSL
ncbi:response regulator [Sulfitobacter sp. BDSS02]|uniref:response regulator n=1 Tax=Heliomarina sp. TaxID=2917556 RepID=UPI004058A6F1|nr:response regulator [Sulfitobacter sp. BDSS02]MBR9852177.1 response regulator transcription factor [Paracoccaceae bacterium]